jgi:hypothetical protein
MADLQRFAMRISPSIVPADSDREIYIVLEDFGPLGEVWHSCSADRETLIGDMLDGQYEEPVRIVAFNTAQGWSRDVTEEIARELHQHCANRGEIPFSLLDFLEEHGS